MTSITILGLIIGLIALFWIIGIYNNLIAKKNQVENTFSTIDVYLKMRFDLIPNLVSIAKQGAKTETAFIEKAISLRNKTQNFDNLSIDDKVHLDNEVSKAFSGFFALSESYPQMQSISLFKEIQTGLAEIEDRISAARRAFNSAITQFNIAVETFPNSIIALLCGYKVKEWFEASEEERANINVNNLFNAE